MQAEHADDITLWLLLAERTGFLSLAGESLMSSMLSSADSGLVSSPHVNLSTPPYAPKVKLLFLEKDMSFLFSLSMALVSL